MHPMNPALNKCPTGKQPISKLERSTARVHPDGRFMERFASVIALSLALAIVGVGAMETFASLLMGCPKKLKRLRDGHQLVTRGQESLPGKPDVTTLPDSYRGSDERASFRGAAENGGYRGSLDSPSWLSNRLCG